MKKQKIAPRNHVVRASVSRAWGSGRHGKSEKAERRANAVRLRKEF